MHALPAGLPAEYGYVLASVAASSILVQWQAIRVGFARRKFKVPLPTMYAQPGAVNGQVFNCMQRSHQNTLENLPAMLACQCLLGLQHPLTAAALGSAWNVGRLIYTLGYSTGDPAKRVPGFFIAILSYTCLVLATLVTGIRATGLLG